MHAQLSPERAPGRRISACRARPRWALAWALALVPGGLAAQTRAADAAVVRAEVVASAPFVDPTALVASVASVDPIALVASAPSSDPIAPVASPSSIDPAVPVRAAPAAAGTVQSADTTRAYLQELLSGPSPARRLRAAPSPPEVRLHTEPGAAGARIVVVRIET